MAFKFGASLMKRIPPRFFQMFRQKDWMKMAEQLAVNQNNLIMFYYRCIISDWRLNVLPWHVSSFIFFYPLNCQCQRVPNYSTVQISEEKKMPYGSIVYVSICYDLIVVCLVGISFAIVFWIFGFVWIAKEVSFSPSRYNDIVLSVFFGFIEVDNAADSLQYFRSTATRMFYFARIESLFSVLCWQPRIGVLSAKTEHETQRERKRKRTKN